MTITPGDRIEVLRMPFARGEGFQGTVRSSKTSPATTTAASSPSGTGHRPGR